MTDLKAFGLFVLLLVGSGVLYWLAGQELATILTCVALSFLALVLLFRIINPVFGLAYLLLVGKDATQHWPLYTTLLSVGVVDALGMALARWDLCAGLTLVVIALVGCDMVFAKDMVRRHEQVARLNAGSRHRVKLSPIERARIKT